MAPLTSHHLLPPFSNDSKTAPLVSVSFSDLENGNKTASDILFKACRELGFFYLDFHGSELGEQVIAESEELNKLQRQFFALPNNMKDKFGKQALHPFYSYRYDELNIEAEDGSPLRKEDYNRRKDDILEQSGDDRLACPDLIAKHQQLYSSYVLHCRAVVNCILEHLNTQLELPAGTFANLHRIYERSGDHVRLVQAPPSPFDPIRARKAEHTDFGSITILFNWLGGLQIRLPETEEWVYVRPVPGSCVINLGDAMVKFTAGLLRSNVHRVVPPIGEQAGEIRNSLVFFCRPEDKVILRRLNGGLINAQPVVQSEEPEMTAHDWIMAKGTGKLPGVYTKTGFEKDKDSNFVTDSAHAVIAVR